MSENRMFEYRNVLTTPNRIEAVNMLLDKVLDHGSNQDIKNTHIDQDCITALNQTDFLSREQDDLPDLVARVMVKFAIKIQSEINNIRDLVFYDKKDWA